MIDTSEFTWRNFGLPMLVFGLLYLLWWAVAVGSVFRAFVAVVRLATASRSTEAEEPPDTAGPLVIDAPRSAMPKIVGPLLVGVVVFVALLSRGFAWWQGLFGAGVLIVAFFVSPAVEPDQRTGRFAALEAGSAILIGGYMGSALTSAATSWLFESRRPGLATDEVIASSTAGAIGGAILALVVVGSFVKATRNSES